MRVKIDRPVPRRWTIFLALILFLLVASPPVHGQDDQSLYWKRFDVNITVHPDGTFEVAEHNVINFTSGTFRYGFRELPTIA